MKLNIHFNVNVNIYIRDPQDTKLGMKIIVHSIELINVLGFESFTFKKLAEKINSTEASIYRYFENKNRLLNYLIAWYWEWISVKIDFANANISDPIKRLLNIIEVLSNSSNNNIETEIDEKLLHAIVVNESIKVYHIKEIDDENKMGNFRNYKNLIYKIVEIITKIKPDYPYSNSLASILIDTAINHSYYEDHLPSLVNLKKNKSIYSLNYFLIQLMEKQLEIKLIST